MKTEHPLREPRRRSRLEVWFIIAVSLIGLLGFMSTLSSGDTPEVAGSEESEAVVSAQQ